MVFSLRCLGLRSNFALKGSHKREESLSKAAITKGKEGIWIDEGNMNGNIRVLLEH